MVVSIVGVQHHCVLSSVLSTNSDVAMCSTVRVFVPLQVVTSTTLSLLRPTAKRQFQMVYGFGHTYDTLQSLLILTAQVLARQLRCSSVYQIAINGTINGTRISKWFTQTAGLGLFIYSTLSGRHLSRRRNKTAARCLFDAWLLILTGQNRPSYDMT